MTSVKSQVIAKMGVAILCHWLSKKRKGDGKMKVYPGMLMKTKDRLSTVCAEAWMLMKKRNLSARTGNVTETKMVIRETGYRRRGSGLSIADWPGVGGWGDGLRDSGRGRCGELAFTHSEFQIPDSGARASANRKSAIGNRQSVITAVSRVPYPVSRPPCPALEHPAHRVLTLIATGAKWL
jgi:hypothetical protein